MWLVNEKILGVTGKGCKEERGYEKRAGVYLGVIKPEY